MPDKSGGSDLSVASNALLLYRALKIAEKPKTPNVTNNENITVVNNNENTTTLKLLVKMMERLHYKRLYDRSNDATTTQVCGRG